MSLADELALQDVADELVEEFGRPVSLVPPGTLTDTDKPWAGTQGDGAAVSAFAVFTPARRELVPGTAVQVGDQVATVATRDLVEIPDTSWAMLDGTRRLNFVAFEEVKPGRSTFVFRAQVRDSG
jgi:hypothetical protein